MVLRLVAYFLFCLFAGNAAHADIINRTNSCDKWEHIPANEALKSPVAALLQCNDDNGAWLALQITCGVATAEIELRYRPGFPIVSPLPEPIDIVEIIPSVEGDNLQQEAIEPEYQSLGKQEMLFFNFPDKGSTRIVEYDFETRDWSYRDKQPLSMLYSNMKSGSFADITLLALGITERLPLRGSSKALGPVVEACRIAKKELKLKAKLAQ